MKNTLLLLLLALLTLHSPVARAQNIALGRTGTVSHPADGATLGFYFQTDHGAEYTLNRIVLYNRDDCCPEKLAQLESPLKFRRHLQWMILTDKYKKTADAAKTA